MLRSSVSVSVSAMWHLKLSRGAWPRIQTRERSRGALGMSPNRHLDVIWQRHGDGVTLVPVRLWPLRARRVRKLPVNESAAP